MLSVNFLKILLYLLMRISLFMGHFSVCSTADFSLFLSCSTSSQWHNIRSIGCSPFLHEHFGLSVILYFYKYELILYCPVTNVVKFGVSLIFSFNLSAILGKYNFAIAPFVVQSPFRLPLSLHCLHVIHFSLCFFRFCYSIRWYLISFISVLRAGKHTLKRNRRNMSTFWNRVWWLFWV